MPDGLHTTTEVGSHTHSFTDLTLALQMLYEREINVSISSFWDAGFLVRIGDEMNGFTAERTFRPGEFSLAADWLLTRAGAKPARG